MINYYLLTKPGIVLGNIVTLMAGFVLATEGKLPLLLFGVTLAGLALVMASACVFNNYIDRFIDKKMERTKNRPLVTGGVSVPLALTFATLLGLCGGLLLLYTNLLTLLIALFGFLVYVLLYSVWKSHTSYATFIGSLAGAVPPVVGYSAVTNQVDGAALLLFLLMVLWQMPHFFAIALYRLEEYKNAGLPLLPLKKGIGRTKIHMLLYIMGFIITLSLFTFYHYTGYIYLSIASLLGLIWLVLAIQGFRSRDTTLWAKQMFRFSLVVIIGFSVLILTKA